MTTRADLWGPIGSAIAAACCLGLAPVVSALTAAGLGFLIRDAILFPLLALFLAATLWQLHRDRRRHRNGVGLALGWAGAVLTAAGLWLDAAVVGVGLVLLVAGSFW
ncbi:MAG: MerC family mercury resistance protein, partial [Thermoanaerobaculia bacterium]